MTNRNDFVRVITEQPGDFQTLAVFADWLEDTNADDKRSGAGMGCDGQAAVSRDD